MQAAAPKRWKAGDGKVTEMDTPYTIRAQQLRDIYNSINMKYLTQDERLDVLLTLKHTVKVGAGKLQISQHRCLAFSYCKHNIDRLVQHCGNSIANALELQQSCTKPSICFKNKMNCNWWWCGFCYVITVCWCGHINGLVQDCSSSSALAMELLQSCTKSSVWY